MTVITVLVEPFTANFRWLPETELVILRTWHTKAVKGKSGKLQFKYGSLSEGSQVIGDAGRKEILSRQYDSSIVFLRKTTYDSHACS